MKKLWLGIVGLAAATTANAAVVTYTLSREEGPTGLKNPANFTVYATVAPGAESFGLFAYGVDLGGANITVSQTAPGGFWDVDDETPDPNWDPAASYPQRSGGFTILRQTSPTGAVSGAMDPSAYNSDPAKNNLVIVKGIGQTAGAMNTIPKPTYTNQDGSVVQSKAYARISGSDIAYGTPRNNSFSTNLPAGTVRLFTGTMAAGASVNDLVIENTLDTKAGVFKNNDPNSVDTEANNTINTAYRTWNVTAGGVDVVSLAATLQTPNVAVGGNIAVTGSNNKYISEVDQLTDPSVNKGGAPIVTIGDETGSVYVMAKLTGSAADIANVLSHTTQDVDNTDGQFALLHANYDALFGGGGFNALFKFANTTGAKNFNFEFTDPAHGAVTVDQLAAVPEPATMGLMAFAGLGLVARRRRKA